MNGTLTTINKHNVKRAVPSAPAHLEVVLLDAGNNLQAVADVLRDSMALCIPDPSALEDATPFILLEEAAVPKAEALCRQIARAGGRVEVRPRRRKYKGVKHSLRVRRKAA